MTNTLSIIYSLKVRSVTKDSSRK